MVSPELNKDDFEELQEEAFDMEINAGVEMSVTLREIDDSVKEFDHGLIPSKTFDIVVNATGKIVGGITLRYVDNPYLTLYRGHTGFTVHEADRRKGYATAALVKVMSIAKDLGMKRIVVTCGEDNIASEKTIRKAGLSYEATVDVPENTYLWNSGIKRIKRFSMGLVTAKC